MTLFVCIVVCLSVLSYIRQFLMYGVEMWQACPGALGSGSYIKIYSKFALGIGFYVNGTNVDV